MPCWSRFLHKESQWPRWLICMTLNPTCCFGGPSVLLIFDCHLQQGLQLKCCSADVQYPRSPNTPYIWITPCPVATGSYRPDWHLLAWCGLQSQNILKVQVLTTHAIQTSLTEWQKNIDNDLASQSTSQLIRSSRIVEEDCVRSACKWKVKHTCTLLLHTSTPSTTLEGPTLRSSRMPHPLFIPFEVVAFS